VLAAGLAPVQALMVRQPYMASVFGWEDPPTPAEAHQAAWDDAEVATNRAFGRTFEALEEAERAEFVDLANALNDATASP
jgi:hypothetical protein